jgi:hypothetical protein
MQPKRTPHGIKELKHGGFWQKQHRYEGDKIISHVKKSRKSALIGQL